MNVTLQRAGWTAMVAGSTLAALALALPWGASGRRWRSAFSLVRLVRELEIADGPVAGAFALCVATAPVLAAAVWVAAALRHRLLGSVLAGGVVALTLGTAYAVWRSPLRPGYGLVVGTAAAAAALVGIATLGASLVPRGQ